MLAFFPFALPRRICAHAWPPLAAGLRSRYAARHGLPNRFRRIPIRNRHRIATRCHKSTDFCVATTRAWGNRLNRPGRPLLRSGTLPTSSLFVQRKDTNRLSADAGTGKNVAPSFSPPDRTAMGGSAKPSLVRPGPIGMRRTASCMRPCTPDRRQPAPSTVNLPRHHRHVPSRVQTRR